MTEISSESEQPLDNSGQQEALVKLADSPANALPKNNNNKLEQLGKEILNLKLDYLEQTGKYNSRLDSFAGKIRWLTILFILGLGSAFAGLGFLFYQDQIVETEKNNQELTNLVNREQLAKSQQELQSQIDQLNQLIVEQQQINQSAIKATQEELASLKTEVEKLQKLEVQVTSLQENIDKRQEALAVLSKALTELIEGENKSKNNTDSQQQTAPNN